MDIEAYFNRIGYKGETKPGLEVLRSLQRVHLLNVPFENLDIHYHRVIQLDPDAFYTKIVKNRRGGFCYELNGLFNALLNELGYNTTIISARVYDGKTSTFGKEFDHLAILVELNEAGEYLVDVGFGEFAFYPLQFSIDTVQTDPRGSFVIEEHEKGYLAVSKIIEGAKTPEYIFTKQVRRLSDFADMCCYHQTDPASHFTQCRLISRPTEIGRITITGNTLKVTEGGKTIEEWTFKEEEFETYVGKWFGVEMSR